MRTVFLFIFSDIFVSITHSSKARSLNLNLETIFEFNEKDRKTDLRLIDDVQHFLSKVKRVLGGDQTSSITNTRRIADEPEITFTDFIENLITVLKSYPSDDLEDTFYVIDTEIRQYHYPGCKFRELIENDNMRMVLSEKLEELKQTPAKKLFGILDGALRTFQVMRVVPKYSTMLDFINSLYTDNDSEKLRETLEMLESYRYNSKRTLTDLSSVIKHGIRRVLFDHYSKLSEKDRTTLKIILEGYFDEKYYGPESSTEEKYISNLPEFRTINQEEEDELEEALREKRKKSKTPKKYKKLDDIEIWKASSEIIKPFKKVIRKPKRNKHKKKLIVPKLEELIQHEEENELALITQSPRNVDIYTEETPKPTHTTTIKKILNRYRTSKPKRSSVIYEDDVTQKPSPPRIKEKFKPKPLSVEDSGSSELGYYEPYNDKTRKHHIVIDTAPKKTTPDSVVQRIGFLEKQFNELKKQILIENERKLKIDELENIVNDEMYDRKSTKTFKAEEEEIKTNTNTIDEEDLEAILENFRKTKLKPKQQKKADNDTTNTTKETQTIEKETPTTKKEADITKTSTTSQQKETGSYKSSVLQARNDKDNDVASDKRKSMAVVTTKVTDEGWKEIFSNNVAASTTVKAVANVTNVKLSNSL